MNHIEFILLIKQPEKVTAEHLSDLKELVQRFPSFVQARLLYTKALQLSQSLNFVTNLKLSTLYCGNIRWFYYYMHPERKLLTEPFRKENSGVYQGDYFDMIDSIEREGGDTKQSLKNLAERLKSAREFVVGTNLHERKKANIEENKPLNIPENTIIELSDLENLEIKAKIMIQDKKYDEGIAILRILNLNNPKKSVYFADQIRFLEKVIANSKK